MLFVLNDLSLDDQYEDEEEFKRDLKYIMKARLDYPTFASNLYCSRLMSERPVSRGRCFREIVQRDQSLVRLVLEWINKKGPFFESSEDEDVNLWGLDDGTEVTSSGAGEACRLAVSGYNASCISFPGGRFDFTPLKVFRNYEPDDVLRIENYWNLMALRNLAHLTLSKPRSWNDLKQYASDRFENLRLVVDSFEEAESHPYSELLGDKVIRLFEILHEYVESLNDDGSRTARSEALVQEYFMGNRGLFSDESTSNKIRFEKKLSFRDDQNEAVEVFCPWHGKISHGQFRIHFEWPLGEKRKLRVFYVGPKITKR